MNSIEHVNEHKHLGMIFNSTATWTNYITSIVHKVAKRIGVLRYLKWKLDRKSLTSIYTMYIRSILDYADIIWDNCSVNQKLTIERLQNEAIRIITGLPKRCPMTH